MPRQNETVPEGAQWPAILPGELRPALAHIEHLGERYVAFHQTIADTPNARVLADDPVAQRVAERLVDAAHTLSDADVAAVAELQGAPATVEWLTRAAMADASDRMQNVLTQLGLCEETS